MDRPIEHHDVVAEESTKFQNPQMALDAINMIDSVIQITSDVNIVLDRLMDTVLDIFNSSRAWLFHPCNPKLPHFDVTFESTVPEYPGAKALTQQVPMTDDMADYCRRALSAHDNPEIDPPVGQPVTNDIAIRFNVKSMLFMTLWPKAGEPWMFGLHQCDCDRIWTSDERHLFRMVGKRISACLDSLLYVDQLRDSEEKHRRLFETLTQGVVYQAADGTIISANPAAERILGLSFEQMHGKMPINPRWRMIKEDGTEVPSKDHPVMIALCTGRTVGPVIRGVFHPGRSTYVWLSITVIPLFRLGQTKPFQVYATFEDVTERKRMEEALKAKEAWLGETTNIARVGGWKIDLLGNTLEWTDETFRIHELPTGDPPNVTEAIQFYHAEDRPRVSAAVKSAVEKGEGFDFEARIITAKQNLIWVRSIGHARFNEGRMVQVWGMIQDINERKQAEEALRHRLEYEQLLNEASMIAFVSDDLAELHDRCLALVGERLGVDRAYFFRHDEATDTMDNTHEWCAEGTTPQQDKLQGLPGSAFSWWLQTMRRNEIICYPDIEEIPDEATKKILRSQDIKSILVVPLFINGQYCGFLGLDDCARNREWRQEDVEIFLSLSRIVAMATERMQAKKRLQDERQQLLSIFNGIEEEIYIADPETYEVIFVNDFLEKLLDKDLLGKKCYEQFQGFNAPCEFCTNQIISQNPGKVYRWEYYNPKLNRHYLLFDRIIKWTDGRDVRFEMAIDITEQKNAEEAMIKNEASLKEAQRLAEIGNWSLDLRTGELSISDQMYSIIGLERTPDALDVAAHEKYYTPESWQRFRSAVESARETGKSYEIEMEVVRGSGGNRHVIARGEVLKDENGQAAALRGTLQDITERVNIEKQLNQAQKMESVGRLAGGVAHDFNNMLGVILGHTEMALEYASPTEPLHADLEEIQKAARRSADLTRQLLAFARKQTIAPKVLDLNGIIGSMLSLLRRLIGEDIDLAWKPGHGLGPVKIDPAQIDQILANLCVNARDAIDGVGKVTIETGNACFDEDYCARHAGFVPGDYALLAVSDDGNGMDAETLSHLFEPFFTTKEQGKGTGLGLATVYGIVKQNNGFVNIYSEPGQGTTVKIYLPRHSARTARETETHPPPTLVRGSETLLLVEDEPSILKMTKMMLERTGYRVLAAGTPGEAIELARDHVGEIHLLMTDVVMPEMNGRDLARNLLSLYPNLKRLFMSGYTANVIAHHGVLDEGVQFIQKPFSKQDLAIKVREALETS